MFRSTLTVLFLALYSLASQAQSDIINVLTDVETTPFPPGCVALSLPEFPPSDHADDFIQDTIRAPSILSPSLDAQVEVTIWRMGCPDSGYSIVMVRLEELSGRNVLIPQVFADIGGVDELFHQAQLIPTPAVGNIGQSGNFRTIPADGITMMLAVNWRSVDGEYLFWPEDYNEHFLLEFDWGDYADVDLLDEWRFEVFKYEPALDPPQFAQPIFHGRHTGNYFVDDHPRTGLMLQVGEFKNPGEFSDTNFIFVIFFTYTDDGEQLWITGNTAAEEPGFGEIELEMWRPEGGLFFTNPTGSFEWDDVDMHREGTLKLRVVDCNTLEGDYDFREGGRAGTGTLQFTRMIRIAGYDCNPWED